ncbi:trypsin-like peptidase domain-containing protein [Candidatus Sumerlaeota bacterium]|nr:trypsin-like peptidase domain-containing protein [Candidatus Sumerlaeota bacterium]
MKSRGLAKLVGAGALILLGLTVGIFVSRPEERLAELAAAPAQAAVSKQPASSDPLPVKRAPKPETTVTRIVKKVSDSVVTVGAVKRQYVEQPWVTEFFIGSRLRLEKQRLPYMGSGFIIDKEGHVVTNFHVIDDSLSFFVTLPDGREFEASLVDADRYADIAVLQIKADDGTTLPEPLEFAESDELQIGEQVVAFGNPFGNLMEDSRPTVTAGYISALHRTIRPDSNIMRVYQDMIQTDASINPGNSGGPLVDVNGDVVGVNTFIFSPSGGSTGVSFAIPANRVRGVVDEIKKYGRLRPLLLDFAFRTLRTPRVSGVQVMDVRSGGPAEQAGINVGDVIVTAEGRTVTSREEFYLLFASRQVGDQVKLKLWRNGKESDVVYTVMEAAK